MNDIFALAEGMELLNGKYTIIRMLSHGGFGVTYLAHHNTLDIDVCIKEFFPKALCNRDAFSYEVTVSTSGNVETIDNFMRKFIKEAKSIARQHHEGIIKILDIFEENGTAYYVMDYIEGQSLKQMVEARGPLSLGEAMDYIRQAAEALGYLHGRNMNHLDVKPANMMVDHNGKLTLIDFGLSKHYSDNGRETTMTPMCISRGYSPKEQYLDGGVSFFSPAADIYALGATLYYLLTGITPPEAIDCPIKKLVFPTNIPSNVKAAILHSIQYEPEARPSSTIAFLAELTNRNLLSNIGLSSTIPSLPKLLKNLPSCVKYLQKKNEQSKTIEKPKPSPRKNKCKFFVPDAIFTVPIIIILCCIILILSDTHISNEKLHLFTLVISFALIPLIAGLLNKLYLRWFSKRNNHNRNNHNKVEVLGNVHRHWRTGNLIVQKESEYLCFNYNEWNEISNKSSYTKIGILINESSCPLFCIALEDKDDGEKMSWDTAVSRYGENILPSLLQCEALITNYDDIIESLNAFEPKSLKDNIFDIKYLCYWGKEYNSNEAWLMDINHGKIIHMKKNMLCRVRAIINIEQLNLR